MLAVGGIDCWRYGGNGAATTNGSTRRNELGEFAVNIQHFSQEQAGRKYQNNCKYRKQKTFASGLYGHSQVNAETETHNTVLQHFFSVFRQSLYFGLKNIDEEDTEQQSNRS